MTDKRLADYKDYTQHSKYAGNYMEDCEFYNSAKPFIHLKLDQVCRETQPDKHYDYILSFTPEDLTLELTLKSSDKNAESELNKWKNVVSESVNSLTIREFRPSQAHPEDKQVSDMLKDLSIKLENLKIEAKKDKLSVSATSKF